MTIVRASSGTPSERSSRGSRRGATRPRDEPLHERDGDVERGHEQQRERDDERGGRGIQPAQSRRRRPPAGAAVSDGDRSQVDSVGCAEHQTAQRGRESEADRRRRLRGPRGRDRSR